MGEIDLPKHRHRHHAHDRPVIFYQGNANGKHIVSLDELLGAIEGVHNPKQGVRLSGDIVLVHGLLAQDGDITGGQSFGNGLVGCHVGSGHGGIVLFLAHAKVLSVGTLIYVHDDLGGTSGGTQSQR